MLHYNHNSATINIFVNFEVLTEVVMTSKMSCVCHLISRRFLARLILQPWRWKRYLPPKLWMISNGLYCVIFQKRVNKGKGQFTPYTGCGDPYGCERLRFEHFQTFGSQMAARLSALRSGRFLPPGRFPVLVSVRCWVDPRSIVRLEGLGKLKNPPHPGLEPATFRLVASFYLNIGGMESILGPLGTAATTGLLYLPGGIVRMEKLVEWTVLVGETEILGANLPRRHFVHHKSHLRDPGANPGRRGWKPATNGRLVA
jgi:hypothetical protein